MWHSVTFVPQGIAFRFPGAAVGARGGQGLARGDCQELRESLSQIGHLVESEGEVILTKRGRPSVRITPLITGPPVPSHAALCETVPPLQVPGEDLVREERDRG